MIKNIPIGSMIQRSLDTGKFKLDFILNFFYKHVGIYIGDGQVIHFYKEVKEVTLCEFAQSKKIHLRQIPKNIIHGKAVCEEAKKICYNPNNEYNNNYSFFFKNCEDFAVSCYEIEY